MRTVIMVEEVEVAPEDVEFVLQALKHQAETVLIALDDRLVDHFGVTRMLKRDNKRIKVRLSQPSSSIAVVRHIEVMQIVGTISEHYRTATQGLRGVPSSCHEIEYY